MKDIFLNLKRVVLLCIVAGFRVDINVNIVNADILLWLSKSAMKKAKVNLNFNGDTIDILGKRIKLITSSTSHYYVPITKVCVFYKTFICDLLRIDPMKVKIICKTDNSGMHYLMHSSAQILDKRLKIEMATLWETIANKDIHNITLVPSENQVADVFTKRGVPSSKILQHDRHEDS